LSWLVVVGALHDEQGYYAHCTPTLLLVILTARPTRIAQDASSAIHTHSDTVTLPEAYTATAGVSRATLRAMNALTIQAPRFPSRTSPLRLPIQAIPAWPLD
jgi:hypothetical protein